MCWSYLKISQRSGIFWDGVHIPAGVTTRCETKQVICWPQAKQIYLYLIHLPTTDAALTYSVDEILPDTNTAVKFSLLKAALHVVYQWTPAARLWKFKFNVSTSSGPVSYTTSKLVFLTAVNVVIQLLNHILRQHFCCSIVRQLFVGLVYSYYLAE